MKESRRGDRVVFTSGPGLAAYATTLGGLAMAGAGAAALAGWLSLEASAWIPIGFGLLLACGGCFLFRWETTAFDTAQRRVLWSKQSLLSHRQGEQPFSAIERVLIDTTRSETEISTARLVLQAGAERIPLTSYYSRSRAEWLPLKRRIEQVLGLPQGSLEDDLRALKAQGQTIEAVKVLRRERGLSLAEAKEQVDRL
ncbi:hypothetical protein [Limibacillus halophilus]